MPAGGKLTITAENTVIDNDYVALHLDARHGKYLAITVNDTGSGIAGENLEKIFDPFFTTKEIGKGTGLGLSTVLGIVKGHGGFINVYSETGRGTRFSFYLPAIETEELHCQETINSELPAGNGECVLVVDDEEVIRNVTRITLEEYGYRVLLAADGAQALALYNDMKKDISLIITDMMMPVMDGAALISAIYEINPQLPIIATSGLLEINQPLLPTVKATLPKPCTAEKLLKIMAQVLRK